MRGPDDASPIRLRNRGQEFLFAEDIEHATKEIERQCSNIWDCVNSAEGPISRIASIYGNEGSQVFEEYSVFAPYADEHLLDANSTFLKPSKKSNEQIKSQPK
jgi:hypothetical protein